MISVLYAYALAQAASALVVPAPPAPVMAEGPVTIAKDTVVTVIIDKPLGSVESTPGESFPLHLAEDLTLDGKVVLKAGTTGAGEVIHAAKARWGGKAGELIVNARFLDCGPVRIKLGKMRLFEAGQNRAGEALAVSAFVLPAAFFISGGNVQVPAGTRAAARITQQTNFSAAGGLCAPAAPIDVPNPNPSPEGE